MGNIFVKTKVCTFYVYLSGQSWHLNIHSEDISRMPQNLAVKSQTFLLKFFQDQNFYIHINFTLTICQICTHLDAPKEQKHQRGSKVRIKMNLVLWVYKLFVWAHDRTIFHLLAAQHTLPWMWMLSWIVKEPYKIQMHSARLWSARAAEYLSV